MAKINPNVDKAFDILCTMSQSKEERAMYLSREMALHDEATKIAEAEQRGMRESQINTAKKMLQDGLSTDMIIKYTELTESELMDILNNLN